MDHPAISEPCGVCNRVSEQMLGDDFCIGCDLDRAVALLERCRPELELLYKNAHKVTEYRSDELSKNVLGRLTALICDIDAFLPEVRP